MMAADIFGTGPCLPHLGHNLGVDGTVLMNPEPSDIGEIETSWKRELRAHCCHASRSRTSDHGRPAPGFASKSASCRSSSVRWVAETGKTSESASSAEKGPTHFVGGQLNRDTTWEACSRAASSFTTVPFLDTKVLDTNVLLYAVSKARDGQKKAQIANWVVVVLDSLRHKSGTRRLLAFGEIFLGRGAPLNLTSLPLRP